MAGMSARRTETGVVLEWRTGYEVDNLGFHVYRGPDNGRVRLTTSLLAGSGLLAVARHRDRRRPHVPVERRDGWRRVPPDVEYWVEEIDLNGDAHVARPDQAGDAHGKRSCRGRLARASPRPGSRS